MEQIIELFPEKREKKNFISLFLLLHINKEEYNRLLFKCKLFYRFFF